MRRDGECSSTGTGACGSTICSASSCIGERVGLVCTRLLLACVLPFFTDAFFRSAGISKMQSRCAACHETNDAMSSSRVRRHMRAICVGIRKGAEQAADAEGHACCERAFFAGRLCAACAQRTPKDGRRDTYVQVTCTCSQQQETDGLGTTHHAPEVYSLLESTGTFHAI